MPQPLQPFFKVSLLCTVLFSGLLVLVPVRASTEIETTPNQSLPLLQAAQTATTTFVVTIENLSDKNALPSPLSPGVWAVHTQDNPLFMVGAPASPGLEAIAEDGDTAILGPILEMQDAVAHTGQLDAVPPGGVYSFTFSTGDTETSLSFANMFVQSNDIFVGPGGQGIALFNDDGSPITEQDVTNMVMLWDAGTEVNEAPGMGPNQAPRQAAPNTGPAEGGVYSFTNSSRALPLASGIANVTVTENNGEFTITMENVSPTSGSINTPIAPVFYTTHNGDWAGLFTNGAPDNGQGLESLAEDGSPATLIASYTGADNVDMVGAANTPVGAGGPGPIMGGQRYQFTVTPTSDHPYLTLAAMVVESNDAFLALNSSGVALLDDNGPRSVADINADIHRMLAVWDAGTEANEVPGVGLNQALRQAGPNTGPADADNTVRHYADSSNDLVGFATLDIMPEMVMEFNVVVTNSSGSTLYPGLLTPVAWAVHDETASLFKIGQAASAGLEQLAEDGNTTTLITELQSITGVLSANVAGSGPIADGGVYTFSLTADAQHRYLSLASMVVPSNDTFIAFDSSGIALLNADGTARSNSEIAADIAAELTAWDAGTEQNQAGAIGPDQAPRQANAGAGADEGNGLVRLLNDPVWVYPTISETLKAIISPTHNNTFVISITNKTYQSALPSPLAPGVWVLHNQDNPLFTAGQAASAGLEALAEDGNTEMLMASLPGQTGVISQGTFGPIDANGTMVMTISTTMTDARLSLATMFAQSNDIFISPAGTGIDLFTAGVPITEVHDITAHLMFWDAGTEVNEAPGSGPNQAPRQVGTNVGPAEGGVYTFTNTTRALPLASGIADVTVTESGGTFTVVVENISNNSGSIDTPLAPVFYATHNLTWTGLFTNGSPDVGKGLESLAEDGSPDSLVTSYTGANNVGMVGAVNTPVGSSDAGPIASGQSYQFSVTPDANHPNLTLATMVVQSNDAFLAFDKAGVALLDSNGAARSVADINADIARLLAVWDAGTEANEVPGVGLNQAPRQTTANSGADDLNNRVRRYSDHVNDLTGFAQVHVSSAPVKFYVTLTNTADSTVYPGILTPAAWAIHDESASLFTVGQTASAGLEMLAEDGNSSMLMTELTAMTGVITAQVAGTTIITPGGAYSFWVTPDEKHRYLSVASMVVPSNDTFLAFGPMGIALLEADGSPRSHADLAADISQMFVAWDAGTERNQAGAIGPDQAPYQAAPNTGANEGNGVVEILNDPVWHYPLISDTVRVTIKAQQTAVNTFTVRIENISADVTLPSPFAPGVWAVHNQADSLFTADTADRGLGLVGLAEDGNPSNLATALTTQEGVMSSGIFNTPVGSTTPGPLMPGGTYEFTFAANPGEQLSFATMLVQSNDLFAAPNGAGIDLYDTNGNRVTGDVTNQISMWDVGSEQNEAPGLGPNQAPRQSGPDTGPAEGGVYTFTNATRALPIASSIAEVTVSENNGDFTITFANVAKSSGAIDTPLAPVFYATHNITWTGLFTEGSPDVGKGLESLAEDGSPAALVASYTGADNVGMVGAANTPVSSRQGPIADGQMYEFTVTPDADHPYLTVASMVVESNDAFLAFNESGVALLDANGTPRPVADINADIEQMLAVWDAGTEANEVPGVGLNQAPRQAGANTGAVDADNTVRRYNDSTNDLAGTNGGGFVAVTVAPSDSIQQIYLPLIFNNSAVQQTTALVKPAQADTQSFDITLTNNSGDTVYPGMLTPVVWAVHDNTAQLFTIGQAASAGLEKLAEDGDGSLLITELNTITGVHSAAVAGTAPITPGGSFQFTVMASADHPYLSIASMIVPSNDTFVAFDPHGIRLFTENGEPRSEADIAADIASQLRAWDAGTEQNQAGAAGPDQAPRQSAPNTGADEGNGLVRQLNDPVWHYPMVSDILRVTIE